MIYRLTLQGYCNTRYYATPVSCFDKKSALNGNWIQKICAYSNKSLLIKYFTLIYTWLSAFQRQTGSTFDLSIVILINLMADDSLLLIKIYKSVNGDVKKTIIFYFHTHCPISIITT